MDQFAQLVLSGATVGCGSALVAVGFIIVARVTGVYNFAQGEYVAAGGLITVWAIDRGVTWPAACLLAATTVAVLALVQERLTVAPLRQQVGELRPVVASLGVAVLLRGLALILFGSDPLGIDAFSPGVITVLGARLSSQVLFVWGLTGLALVLTAMLFSVTSTGRAMRAVAIDLPAARQLGISVGPLSMLAFGLSGALMGLLGAVAVPITLVSWNSGVTIGLYGFMAAAIANFRSPVRAVAAGLGLSVVESLAAGYISSPYRTLYVYAVLLLYLVARDLMGTNGFIARARHRPGVRRRRPRPPSAGRRQAGGRLSGTRSAKVLALIRIPVVVIAVGTLGLSFANSRLISAATVAVFLAIGATGLGLTMGLAGQLSLGQGGMFLVGGYSAAILSADHGWPTLAALAAGVAVSSVGGAGIGWITLRLESFNLAIATLAVHLGLVVVATQAVDLTGGQLGKYGVPPPRIGPLDLSSSRRLYVFGLIALACCLVGAKAIWRSRLGRQLRAIGADAVGATSAGLNPFALKLKVFVVSSACAGLAGALWAFHLRFADPSTWGVALTIDLVAFVIVGGTRSPYGGLVGVTALQSVRFLIESRSTSATAQNLQLVLAGCLLILFSMVFRGGIVQTLQGPLAHLRGTGTSVRTSQLRVPLSTVMSAAGAAESGAESSSTTGDSHFERLRPILEVEGLTKSFGASVAVDRLDLRLTTGQVTAMIGPNGAGKSTVINLLSGELVPSAGTILLERHRIGGLRPNEIHRLGLVRTFQTPRTFPGLTVLETVLLSTTHSRHPDQIAIDALDFVGLSGVHEHEAASLPGGSQRLLEVARSLASAPTVMLMDEPAAGLDDTETRALATLIRRIADTGVAVLLVEHSVDLVLSVADTLIVLDRGALIAQGQPRDVVNDGRVIDAYLGAPT